MALTTTVHVPATATLRIHTDAPGIDDRDATADDLAKLGYISRSDVYQLLRTSIALAATGDADTDLTDNEWCDTNANLVRYLVEVAVNYETTPDAVIAHLDDDGTANADAIRAILSAPTPTDA